MSTRAIPLSVLRASLADLDRRIDSTEIDLSELRAQRSALAGIMDHAVDMIDPNESAKKHAQRPESTTSRILITLANRPGLQATELAELLHEQIESEAEDKRRVVYNTAMNLVSQERLRKDPRGGLHVDSPQELMIFGRSPGVRG